MTSSSCDHPAGRPAPQSEDRLKILARKLGILHASLPGGLVVNVVVAAAVAFFLYSPETRGFLVPWLAAALMTTVLRIGDLFHYRIWGDPKGPALHSAVRRFHALVGLQGLLWGAAGFTLIPRIAPVEQLFLTLVVSGMAGGAVIYLSAVPTVYLTYLVPTLLPSCVRLLQSPDMVQRGAGMLGIVYALGMVFAASKTGRWIDNSIRAALSNEALVAHQKEMNAELVTYRDHLEREVADRTAELTAANRRLTEEIAEKEAKGREAEQLHRRFRELTEMLPEMVFELDGGGSLTYLNRKFYELTGHGMDDFPEGPAAGDLVTPDDAGLFREIVASTLGGISPPPTAFTTRRKDGSEFPVMILCAPIERDGACCGVRGLAVDMTRQQELEARVREAAKLEALGTLAGGVAHDFNNILAVIVAQAEVTLENQRNTPALADPLRRIVEAAERATQLVNQILTFARRHEEQTLKLDLGSEVAAALDLVSASLPPNTTLTHDVLGTQATVLGDPTQIHQVVLNLCTNASQAMGDQAGTVNVTLRSVTIDSADPAGGELPPGPYAELRVSDTGPGISEAVRERMFEPFYTTKELGRGTGMGLAVVHGVVSSSGGAIRVESRHGEGATFLVYLPIVAGAPVSEAAPSEEEPPHGTERVLLVDDDEAVSEAVADGLEAYGYQARAVSSAVEAWEIISRATEIYDLVITDYSMPEMSGVELAERIHRQAGPNPPRVILCTGNINAVAPGSIMAASIAAVLQKPVRPRDLARTIRRTMAPGTGPAAAGEVAKAGCGGRPTPRTGA